MYTLAMEGSVAECVSQGQADLFDAVDIDTGQVFIPNNQDPTHPDVALTRNQCDGNSTRSQQADDCISVNANVLIAQWAVGGIKPLGPEWTYRNNFQRFGQARVKLDSRTDGLF
jgi:hypothetical protein